VDISGSWTNACLVNPGNSIEMKSRIQRPSLFSLGAAGAMLLVPGK
jgi:hypothetical protein